MTWISPHWLWALVLLAPLALLLGMWARSGARAARAWADPSVMRVGPDPRGARMRALAAALALLAVAGGVVAMARPAVTDTAQERRSAVMIALDVSASMDATDLVPSRLQAAIDAAERLAAEAPPSTAIGVTTFADRATVVLAPTTDRDRLGRVLDGVGDTREGTALGEAVATSLAALDAAGSVAEPPPSDPAASPGRILVLTDGANSIRRALSPEDAATRAAAAGVPVYTILLGDDPGRPDQPLPEETLSAMATRTGGVFAQSTTTEDLRAVFADIGSIIAPLERVRQLTVWAAAGALGALLLAALAAGLAAPRPPRTHEAPVR